MSPSPSYFLELHALCGGEVTVLSGAEQSIDCVQEKQETQSTGTRWLFRRTSFRCVVDDHCTLRVIDVLVFRY